MSIIALLLRSLKRIRAIIVLFFVCERISWIRHALLIIEFTRAYQVYTMNCFKNNYVCSGKCMRQEACIITELNWLSGFDRNDK